MLFSRTNALRKRAQVKLKDLFKLMRFLFLEGYRNPFKKVIEFRYR